MSLQTVLVKRVTARIPLQTAAGADAYNIEENIVDRIETVRSSTLIKDRKTTMSNRDRVLAFLCSIYSMDCRYLAEEHDFGIREDLSKKVDIDLADPLYTVRRNQNDDGRKYDVFDSNDMKDTDSVLGEVMKPAADEDVSSFAV